MPLLSAPPRTFSRTLLIVLAAVALAAVTAGSTVAAEAPDAGSQTSVATGPVDYLRDVKPLLADRCYACHGPDEKARKAELRLDVRDVAIESAIVPGDAAASPLVERITSHDPDERMPPPKANKRALSSDDTALLRRWIDEGAPFATHWAYVPPARPPVPDVKDTAWPRDAIDRFILARIERAGLRPSTPADPRTLVRRLHFDLTGLPPTSTDVEAFEAAYRDDPHAAVASTVKRLLASPHYGERMAMHWLDVVRYADSNGIHSDKERSVWPYRDWVIEAFNANMPLDRFCIEQVAGDLLPDADRRTRIASGHNRMYMTTDEGGVAQAKEYTAKYAADRVRNVAAGWLGSTMGCAECHDHKFDPFSTRDFYSMSAFFADLQETAVGQPPTERVPSSEQQTRLDDLQRRIAEAERRLATPTPDLEAAERKWEASLAEKQIAWNVVVPQTSMHDKATRLDIQKDGTVVAVGPGPERDTYVLSFDAPQERITALRLEVLTDEKHPRKGPGRADNGNFVLNEFVLEVDGKPRAWSTATATHSQKDWGVAGAADGKSNTGWAILDQAGRANTAVFELKDDLTGAARLTLKLVQNYGSRHTLGRFRLAVTDAERPVRATGNGLPPEINAILAVAPEKRDAKQREKLASHYRGIAPALSPVRKEVEGLKKAKTAVEKEFPLTLVSKTVKPRTVRVLPRGNWLDDSGEVVEPAVPAFLGGLAIDNSAGDHSAGENPAGERPADAERRATRLDLAGWLVDRENPLVARVFVNRVWKLFFGRGIVATADDFGSQGTMPTHPQLLDWLAVDFVENGWDVKRLVAQIVTSEAYRQSSRGTAELVKRDPQNDFFARQARFRLPAEMVRDNALAVSGLLVPQIGGPSVKPYQPAGYWAHLNFPRRTYAQDKGEKLYRRGLYTHWQRTFLHPSLMAFDAPTREECTVSRPRSNTPQQALALLNDPTYVEAARVFAERIVREGGADAPSRLAYAFREAVSRAPRDDEMKLLVALLEKHRAQFKADTPAAGELIRAGEFKVAEDLDPVDLAAWTSVARVILNLHETITRY